jgi:hypothetical protein
MRGQRHGPAAAGEFIRNQKFSTFDLQFRKGRESIGEQKIAQV